MRLWKSLIFVCLVQTEGRQLPLEKIILGSTSFQSSPQADWGQQAVKEQVITPVPLRNWMVLYVNRDKSKALDFVTMMNKVTPAMGIEVSVQPSATSKVIKSHLAMFLLQVKFKFRLNFFQPRSNCFNLGHFVST